MKFSLDMAQKRFFDVHGTGDAYGRVTKRTATGRGRIYPGIVPGTFQAEEIFAGSRSTERVPG